MHFLKIQTSWGFDEIEFQHCPVCGSPVLGNVNPCEHLLFSYSNEVGEFQNVATSVRSAVDAAHRQREELEERDPVEAEDLYLPEAAARRYKVESAVCFAFGARVTGGGYAVAIDFEG